MSTLSVTVHKLAGWLSQAADFVKNEISTASADKQPALNNAVTQLSSAAQAVEAALPTVAEVAIDSLLAKLGYGQYIPNVNGLIDSLIAALQARKTGAPPAA